MKGRNRYAEGGIEALSDVQRPGREREIDELALIADTLTNDGKPRAELGISHWSAPDHGRTPRNLLFLGGEQLN
ncbi:hypothetical protein [Arthrobacter sp. UYEF21]|uniref:hypothetical protein n=1 Tax=Arthrobacter sp. UYEF21 TaxID=1756364 RepID=UPI0033957268